MELLPSGLKTMIEVIRFNYLYRDSANYKTFGHKLFSNPELLTKDEITERIRQNLIDTEFFYPESVGIRKFKFHRNRDDYSWYEFESIEIIKCNATTKKHLLSINQFISHLKQK
jgi:hypothetical protein